jgi:hypothetical protein
VTEPDDTQVPAEATAPVVLPLEPTPQKARSQILLLIGGAIMVAFALTTIALTLYRVDGTIQSDLSLPEYADQRSQIEPEDKRTFSATGDIDAETMENFRMLYDDHLKKIVDVNAFDSEALSDDAIGLGPVFEQ